MKCYLLLRDNKQSGPWSADDLKQHGLKRYDLIWKEGASTSWQYPTELSELKDFLIEEDDFRPDPVPFVPRSGRRTAVFVSLPAGKKMEKRPQPKHQTFHSEEPQLEVLYEQPLAEIKERYMEHLNTRKFRFQNSFSRSNGFWIFGLMIFLFMGALVVKKIVEAGEVKMEKENIAAAILPVQSLPEGETAEKPADYSVQNAIAKEVVAPVSMEKTEKSKPVTMKNLKKQVKLTGSDFKVGLFGGINNLQLTIHNGSSHMIDRVNVVVEFLKKGGHTVYTEEFAVYSIAPKSKKILDIPPTRRGITVKYRIVNVQSKQYAKARMLKA